MHSCRVFAWQYVDLFRYYFTQPISYHRTMRYQCFVRTTICIQICVVVTLRHDDDYKLHKNLIMHDCIISAPILTLLHGLGDVLLVSISSVMWQHWMAKLGIYTLQARRSGWHSDGDALSSCWWLTSRVRVVMPPYRRVGAGLSGYQQWCLPTVALGWRHRTVVLWSRSITTLPSCWCLTNRSPVLGVTLPSCLGMTVRLRVMMSPYHRVGVWLSGYRSWCHPIIVLGSGCQATGYDGTLPSCWGLAVRLLDPAVTLPSPRPWPVPDGRAEWCLATGHRALYHSICVGKHKDQ